MLARSFKSAAELQITEVEHQTLITVLGMLERGDIKPLPQHAGRLQLFDILRVSNLYDYPLGAPQFFDMRQVCAATECGTSCCILGWAQYVGHNGAFASYNHVEPHQNGLDCLFFPYSDGLDCTEPQQGAMALRNYLTSGFPRWREVMRS